MANEFIIYQIPIFNKPYNELKSKIERTIDNSIDANKEYYRKKANIMNYQTGFLEVKFNGCSIDYNLYLKLNSKNIAAREFLFSKTKKYYQFIAMSTKHTNITISTDEEIIECITTIINEEKNMIEELYKVYLHLDDFLELIKIINFKNLINLQ